MGYASFLEDIVNKLSDMNSMIDNSTQTSAKKTQTSKKEKQIYSTEEMDEIYESLKFTQRQLNENKIKLSKTELDSKNAIDEIKKMRHLIGALREQNEILKYQINEKESLLVGLRKVISSILEKNEIARKAAENRSREILDNTVNKVNDENAEIVLQLKSGILQIGSILQQQNFYKKQDNINTIRLIIKRLTGLY
jgi:hypothetical protein